MRREAKQVRAALDPAWGAALSALVLAHWPPQPGEVWAGYWPMGTEIDIRPLLHRIAEKNPVVLPVTTPNKPLVFRRWFPGDAMQPERFGTHAPTGDVMLPDVLLVPLLAFDATGARLGYGGGYYDRTLAALPGRRTPRHRTPGHPTPGHRTIGCAFAAQQVDHVPTGPHDVRLDAVATERGVIWCRE